MAELKVTKICDSCKGVGTRTSYDIDDNPITEDPCTGCDGEGKVIVSIIDITELSDKIDYIKTRVKKIWLKVKDEGDGE